MNVALDVFTVRHVRSFRYAFLQRILIVFDTLASPTLINPSGPMSEARGRKFSGTSVYMQMLKGRSRVRCLRRYIICVRRNYHNVSNRCTEPFGIPAFIARTRWICFRIGYISVVNAYAY